MSYSPPLYVSLLWFLQAKAHMRWCQHLQRYTHVSLSIHALSTHGVTFANRRTRFGNPTWTHTHTFWHTKAPPPRTRQYVPTTCEGTHTAINLPFFSPSFPLSSWEPSAGAFASNPNIDQIPKTPTQTPPRLSLSFSPLPPLFLSFGFVFGGKRQTKCWPQWKSPGRAREWVVR